VNSKKEYNRCCTLIRWFMPIVVYDDDAWRKNVIVCRLSEEFQLSDRMLHAVSEYTEHVFSARRILF